MNPDEQSGKTQRTHWDGMYTGNPAFFGEDPSEFGKIAVDLFRREGIRKVLELGCGQGRDTFLFARSGFEVTALDYSEEGLRILEAQAAGMDASPAVITRVFDVRKPLPFPDGTFDACFSHMLLCMELSTGEIEILLREIRRVLRPGGLALYSVRNTEDKHYRTGLHTTEDMYEIGGFVVHFFSEEKVRSLAAGYKILDLRRMQEGSLPRELFGVVLRKRDEVTDGSVIQGGEERDVTGHMEKFQDFFHAVYNTGVLDRKTKHLVALGASLAAACDS